MYFKYFSFVLFILILFYFECISANKLSYKYYKYNELTSILQDYASQYPDKTYLYSIGKTVQGREIWVLALSNDQPDQQVLLRPEAKYIGNIHGNEPTSKAVLLQFIDHILSNPNDRDVNYLMSNTRIHVLPSMNPDGFEVSNMGDCMSIRGRYNGNNYDLNRNFQDLFECNMAPLQPETLAVMRWLENNKFILSANFHSGSIVANYPYDNYIGGLSNGAQPSIADDNDVFITLAKNYSFNHRTMRFDPCNNGFVDGITNGAEWYPLRGGMQDFNYWRHGCMELTIEITCCKYPLLSSLENIWLENRKSLIEFMKQANIGVKGIINFNNGVPARYVTVQINSIEPLFKTNDFGEYYKILLPGHYKLTVLYDCTPVYVTNFKITNSNPLVRFDITLSPILYNQYLLVANTLTKYSMFCSPSRKPVPCPNAN